MNDLRQYSLFASQPRVSGVAVILITFGVFLIVPLPPMGLVMILLGIDLQRRRTTGQVRDRKARRVLAEEYATEQRMRAYLAL